MKRSRLKRRKAMKRISSRQEAINTARRVELMAAYSRSQRCEFPEGCSVYAADWHERLPRGQGGSATDTDNRVWLCRAHHRWVHEHPIAAQALGLREWKWRSNDAEV